MNEGMNVWRDNCMDRGLRCIIGGSEVLGEIRVGYICLVFLNIMFDFYFLLDFLGFLAEGRVSG